MLLLVVLLFALGVSLTACAESETDADEPAEEQSEGGDSDDGGGDSGDGGDTGRMSEGEFEMFSDFDLKFADELQQWSSGYATCATIAQTGDLAGFRDCIKEEWKGVEDAGLVAYGNAKDTRDDVGKQCLKMLRAYATRVDQVYTRNLNAYDAATSLDVSAITREFKPLTKAARQYASASAKTRDACNPT